jgi:uncharacterized membrane protein YhfC
LSESWLHSTLLPGGGIILPVTTFLLSLNYILMIVLPLLVAAVIRRRTRAPWRFFFIGAVTFVVSQIFHIPFNWLVQRSGLLPSDTNTWANLIIVAAFLGLSAGVFEEGARYLTYRYWAKDARSWSRAMMLGAGHGGIEAIIVGLLGGIGFASLVLTAANEALLAAVPEEQRSLIAQSLNDLLATPWYGLLLGAVERAFAIAAHLALSVMVLQVFLRRNIGWLFLAIGYHALFNAAAVIGISRTGPYTTEAILGVMSLFSLFIIFRLRTPEPPEAVAVEPEPLLPGALDALPTLEPTAEALDRSRYSE